MNRKPLKRTGFKRRAPERKPAPALRPIELPAGVRPMTEPGGGVDTPKRAVVVSEKLRRSARGEACTLGIVAVCNQDPATTVLAHLPSEIARSKSTDICACFACSACHAVIDRAVPHDWVPGEREWYLLRAMIETQTRWIERGLLVIPSAA